MNINCMSQELKKSCQETGESLVYSEGRIYLYHPEAEFRAPLQSIRVRPEEDDDAKEPAVSAQAMAMETPYQLPLVLTEGGRGRERETSAGREKGGKVRKRERG